MVAHQTLTLFVRVRILHPLPEKHPELLRFRVFLYLFAINTAEKVEVKKSSLLTYPIIYPLQVYKPLIHASIRAALSSFIRSDT